MQRRLHPTSCDIAAAAMIFKVRRLQNNRDADFMCKLLKAFNIENVPSIPSSGAKIVRYAEAKERCVAKGLKPDTFDDALERYEEMGLWCVNQQRTTITIV